MKRNLYAWNLVQFSQKISELEKLWEVCAHAVATNASIQEGCVLSACYVQIATIIGRSSMDAADPIENHIDEIGTLLFHALSRYRIAVTRKDGSLFATFSGFKPRRSRDEVAQELSYLNYERLTHLLERYQMEFAVAAPNTRNYDPEIASAADTIEVLLRAPVFAVRDLLNSEPFDTGYVLSKTRVALGSFDFVFFTA